VSEFHGECFSSEFFAKLKQYARTPYIEWMNFELNIALKKVGPSLFPFSKLFQKKYFHSKPQYLLAFQLIPLFFLEKNLSNMGTPKALSPPIDVSHEKQRLQQLKT